MSRFRQLLLFLAIFLLISQYYPAPVTASQLNQVKYVILLIGDGYGANLLEAANRYTNTIPAYQSWRNYWVTTYPEGGSYDPSQAWENFMYVNQGYTDSAAAATAIFTGVKTLNGRINVSADGSLRLTTLAEEAHIAGLSAGAVTSVPISHATPGAWLSHNDNRSNGYAIADEALWGNPNTTGTPMTDSHYGGSHGITNPPLEVLIGGGYYLNDFYVNAAIRDRLILENGQPTFVERQSGVDGGTNLLDIASNSQVTRLAGLFGGSSGDLEYRLADGSGANPENPTLAQMAEAALKVLERDPDGFVLMIEGGAIDHAAHGNNLDQALGEVIDFNHAIQTVIEWVEDPGNDSTWNNTLVIVTADHETGYLTASPGAFPNQPLGAVTPYTLTLEKTQQDNGRRASWVDNNSDNLIDDGEPVYWAWNSSNHTNSLVRLFTKGLGETEFFRYAQNWDPVRGLYLDNTDIYKVVHTVLSEFTPLVIYTYSLPVVFR